VEPGKLSDLLPDSNGLTDPSEENVQKFYLQPRGGVFCQMGPVGLTHRMKFGNLRSTIEPLLETPQSRSIVCAFEQSGFALAACSDGRRPKEIYCLRVLFADGS